MRRIRRRDIPFPPVRPFMPFILYSRLRAFLANWRPRQLVSSGQEGLMISMQREIGATIVLAAVLFAPSFISGQGRGAQPPAGGFPDLVGALKATSGVVGVETARTSSGKQVIFAWFENKKAALTWYYSDTHMKLVKGFAPGAPPRTPMADVPDDGQPVLAIASLTLTGPPTGDVAALPVSQIAIELYRPLPGGLAAGGRFAPEALKVPGLQTVTLPISPKDEQ